MGVLVGLVSNNGWSMARRIKARNDRVGEIEQCVDDGIGAFVAALRIHSPRRVRTVVAEHVVSTMPGTLASLTGR